MYVLISAKRDGPNKESSKLGVRFDCVGWGGEEGYAAVCAHDGYTTITMLAECVLGYQMRAKLKVQVALFCSKVHVRMLYRPKGV